MLKWIRTRHVNNSDGTTITYEAEGTDYIIESRKRHIPHAVGSGKGGTWDYTSYFVVRDGEDIKELHSLKDAKEYVKGVTNQ